MAISLEQLERALIVAYPGSSRPVLPRPVAVQRARWLYNDLQAWRFDLQLTWQRIDFPGLEPMGVPKYRLPESPYNASKGTEGRKAGEDHEMFHAEGSDLDCPDLLKLSRVSEIGHTLLTHTNWPHTHAKRLRDVREHGAVIEELLWLGRWRNPRHIRLNVPLVTGSKKDVDFCFQAEGLTVNVEVKHRPSTWLTRADGGFDVRGPRSLFDGVEGKFPASSPSGTYNVVALTTMIQADDVLRHHAKEFLRQHPEIAAVVVWSDHAPDSRHHEFIVGEKGSGRLLELLFKSDEEERHRAGIIWHPLRNSAERCEMTFEESLRLIQRMAAEEG